jgi:hypothetical protein
MQLRQLALQHPPCVLQDVSGAGVQRTPLAMLHLQLYILRRSLREVRDMQVVCVRRRRPQRHMQYMQQEGVQQLLAEKGAHQEQDNLPRLLAVLINIHFYCVELSIASIITCEAWTPKFVLQ